MFYLPFALCLSVFLFVSLSVRPSVCLSLCRELPSTDYIILSLRVSSGLSICRSKFLLLRLFVSSLFLLLVGPSLSKNKLNSSKSKQFIYQCLPVRLSLTFSVCLSICVFLFLSVCRLSVCLRVLVCLCLSVCRLSVCLRVLVCLCLSVLLSVYMSVWLPI